jgi:hypothetical protein
VLRQVWISGVASEYYTWHKSICMYPITHDYSVIPYAAHLAFRRLNKTRLNLPACQTHLFCPRQNHKAIRRSQHFPAEETHIAAQRSKHAPMSKRSTIHPADVQQLDHTVHRCLVDHFKHCPAIRSPTSVQRSDRSRVPSDQVASRNPATFHTFHT